jgi:hypothetical protein
VAFDLLESGAYRDMETLWGGRVRLTPGRSYLGVVCERGSTKFITASFDGVPPSYGELVLQLVAQGGGVGYCTGFSPDLAQECGCGRASNVAIIGQLYDNKKAMYLNTVDLSGLSCDLVPLSETIPPTVLVLGTATNVGKTTVVKELLKAFSSHYICAAIKASGTGWYEDSLFHMDGGASLALNFTFTGLPTTYYVDPHVYKNSLYQLYRYVSHPMSVPPVFLPPARRGAVSKADVLFVEHGGDMIWASIPVFLTDDVLMHSVKMIVICSEGALGFMGALGELRRLGIVGSSDRKVYASMPFMNPEAFIRRVQGFLDQGEIRSILDIGKPEGLVNDEARFRYSQSHYLIKTAFDLLAEWQTTVSSKLV